MDFKSLMASQISKSKPQSASNTNSKYLRRAEVEANRQAEYAAEQARLETEREERQARKRKIEEEEAERDLVREEKKRKLAEESKARREEEEAKQERLRRKRLGLPELPDKDKRGETPLPEGEDDVPEEDLQAKLRGLNEPAILFGESHVSRLRRYRSLTTAAKVKKLSKTPIPTTLEILPEAEMAVPAAMPPDSDRSAVTHLHRQLASYFTLLLTEWQRALSTRSSAVANSQSGRQAYSTYASVLLDLTPLFRHFEAQTLPNSLLKPITSIVHSAQSRRYVEANDGYLRLSIGKAAWPIGVTMVGIHERSAREKLHESGRGGGDKEAHIMSDEVTRKYLQSIKRCLSFAQTRWPPEDVGQLMG